jgi:hypothetical protein
MNETSEENRRGGGDAPDDVAPGALPGERRETTPLARDSNP